MFEMSVDNRKVQSMFRKVIDNSGWHVNKGSKFVIENRLTRLEPDLLKSLQIEVGPDQYAVEVSGYYVFADYGTRSKVPGMFFYVFDQYGIVEKFKIGGEGNLRDGWRPTVEKVVSQWKRTETEVPEWMTIPEEPKEEPKVEMAEAGRYVFEGTVVSYKLQFSDFGATYKMLVKNEMGQKFFGTVPRGISIEDVVGAVVKIKATVEPKENGFSFFKRPVLVSFNK